MDLCPKSLPQLAGRAGQGTSWKDLPPCTSGNMDWGLRAVEKAMTTLLDALASWKQSQISYNVSYVCYLDIWLGVQNIIKASVFSVIKIGTILCWFHPIQKDKFWTLQWLQISQGNPSSTIFWSCLQQCPQSIFLCSCYRFPHVPNLHMIGEVSFHSDFSVLNYFSLWNHHTLP